MSVAVLDVPAAGVSARASRQRTVDARFPLRPRLVSWPATREVRAEAQDRLNAMPFVGADPDRRSKRAVGMRLLLDWLSDQPGQTWQERWLASGAAAAGQAWRQVPAAWLDERGHGPWRRDALVEAVPVAISADLVRPSLGWLLAGGAARGGLLVRNLAASRDPDGFTRLRDLCAGDPSASLAATTQMLYRATLILAAKGGTLTDITIGDVVELLDHEAEVRLGAPTRGAMFYRVLQSMGIFSSDAPSTLRAVGGKGQRTPQELIDRYGLRCQPVRDLLVDYLRERQPALDYTSLDSLSYYLGMRFWADIEHHLPASTACSFLATSPTTGSVDCARSRRRQRR